MAPKSVAQSGGGSNNSDGVFFHRLAAIQKEVLGIMWSLHGIAETDFQHDRKGMNTDAAGPLMCREMVRSVAIRCERFAERQEWADLLQWAKDCGKLGVPQRKPERAG